jgi:hypothetical protein
MFLGRCRFRVHIKGKPHATGLKYYVIATSSNYIFDFWLYMGNESDRKSDTLSIVSDFVNKLESLPYSIFRNKVPVSNR